MAYVIKGRSGQPVVKDGKNIFGADVIDVKLLDLDEKEGTFTARASSKKEDRDKDILHQDGFELKNFKKNPVIPWSHNYWEPPVAKSIKTWVDSDLMFTPKFDLNDEFAVKIFNKYKGGFLSSFSVGFIGIEYTSRDEKDPWFGGREFTKMELLEISCVTVPANPQANVNVGSIDNTVKSLVELGYPDIFTRTKNSLFYPIRDPNEFTNPTLCKLKRLQLVYGKTISDKHPEAADMQLVGFSFLPDWKEPDAMSFVKRHSDPTRKMWMYQLNADDDKGLVVTEIVSEKEPILEFSAAIDLGEKDMTGISISRVVGEKCIDEEPPPKLEDEKCIGEEPSVKLEDEKVPDAPIDALGLVVEVKIDELIPQFISSLNLVAEGFKALSLKVDEVLAKKSIDLQKVPCDNDIHGIRQQEKSMEDSGIEVLDDSIELDGNLLTPEEKASDNPDQIEIDIQDLTEISQLAKTAGESIALTLRTSLMDALKESGRID